MSSIPEEAKLAERTPGSPRSFIPKSPLDLAVAKLVACEHQEQIVRVGMAVPGVSKDSFGIVQFRSGSGSPPGSYFGWKTSMTRPCRTVVAGLEVCASMAEDSTGHL